MVYKMKNIFKYIFLIVFISGFFAVSGNLLAVSKTATSSSLTKNPAVKIQKLAQKEEGQKKNASKEIDRRIESLNKLIVRIQEMKKLSDADKTALINQANEQIIALEALKVKIDSDTDPATLKTDRQSITNQYRIYMLFIPKIQILASADRIIEICDDTSVLITKFQDRFTQAALNGKDVTVMQTTLKNIQAKMADAKLQAQSAQSLVIQLVPDNGDANIAKSNNKALQDARAKLVLAKKDITDAQKDILTIRKALTTEKPKLSTSSASPSALRR